MYLVRVRYRIVVRLREIPKNIVRESERDRDSNGGREGQRERERESFLVERPSELNWIVQIQQQQPTTTPLLPPPRDAIASEERVSCCVSVRQGHIVWNLRNGPSYLCVSSSTVC